MKSKILNVTLTLVMLFVTLGVFAQTATTTATKPASAVKPAPKPLTMDQQADEHVKNLNKRLMLTSEQIPQARALWMTSLKQTETDKTTAAGDKAKLKDLQKKNDETRMAGIRKILTPEQLKIYNAPPPAPVKKTAPASAPAGK